MKNKKAILLMWLLALLPSLELLLAWSKLPEQVPMQWGFDGVVGSYGPKSQLWVIAGMGLLIPLLLQVLPKIDPKKENYQKFQKIYDGFALAVSLFMAVIMAFVLTETLRPGSIAISRVIMVFLSFLLMAVGAIMGKIKTNWFMGVRTPWALSDPDVWNKTYRLGGWVFFLTGLVELPVSIWCPEKVMAAVLLVGILGGTILTYFMSWKWYKDKFEQNKED